MKYDTLYRQLQELAEKLDITFAEKNFRSVGIAGIHVNSGLCRVEGKLHFLMDKHIKIREKTEVLAQALSEFPIDDMYVAPAVREFIEKNRK